MLALTAIDHPQKKYIYTRLLLSFALLGMMGSCITFLRFICTGNMRWGVLVFLFIYFILKKKFVRYIDARFGFFLFLYLAWCSLTFFWSSIPILSFMKSGISIIVAITMIRAGIECVKINSRAGTLNCLWVLAFIALLAGVLGKHSAASYINSEYASVQMFQGLVKGSNMFGTLLAMTLPYFIWQSYSSLPNKKKCSIWIMLSVVCFYFILASFCRSALLVTFLIFAGFLFSLNLSKKITLFLMSLILLMSFFCIFPSIIQTAVEVTKQYVFKGSSGDMFHSRESVWKISYEKAMEGGWFGLGYGINVDQSDIAFNNGLLSWTSTREKGNSQMAILEEAGIICFVLYVLLLMNVVNKLIKAYLKTKDPHQRVLIGIVAGTFLGMIAHSMFEAWWTSPGAPESIYFWMLVGIILGIDIQISNDNKRNMLCHESN